MFPTKTDKARDELQGGQRTLSQRERALLLMADGRRSLTDFSPLFTTRDEAEQALLALVQRGYLQDAQAAAALASRAAGRQAAGRGARGRADPVSRLGRQLRRQALAGDHAHVPVRHLRAHVRAPRPRGSRCRCATPCARRATARRC
jgi:hypothetical protein